MREVIIAAIFAGTVAVCLGSIIGIAIFRHKGNSGNYRIYMAFSVGVIVGLLCFSILPESLEIQSAPLTILLVAIGAFASFFATHSYKNKPRQTGHSPEKNAKRALLLVMAVAVHSFPEGLALGAGFGLSFAQGMVWALMILLHNIPIGISMGITQSYSGINNVRTATFAALSGTPILIGAITTEIFKAQSDQSIAVLLSLAGGALLAVVVSELKELLRQRPIAPVIIAAVIGLALCVTANYAPEKLFLIGA